MRFANPFWLALLAFIPLAWWLQSRWSHRRSSIRFPSAQLVGAIRPSLWQRLGWLPRALRLGSLALLVVALARPQKPNDHTRVNSEGIAIQMVVDCSGSMQIEDFAIDGKSVSRLDAVKNAFTKFVIGDGGELSGRPDDLIGLVKFANFPDIQCPLTLSREALAQDIAGLKPAIASDDGTNIGDAVAWALEDLKTAKVKSRVIVLLTDGANNPAAIEGLAPPLDPLEAARIATGLGVKLYTIGAGSTGGVARLRGQLVRIPPLDEQLLQRMAEISGGKYFRANDSDGLRKIYAEIDRLERNRTESVAYIDYHELFPPLAWLALAGICVEQCLVATRMRRIP